MRTLLFGIALASLASCVKTNAFKCEGDNAACGANGQCEADGFCSIPSDRCGTGGREYSDTAGELSGTCVGGGPQPDGPAPDDGPDQDGPGPDGPATGCNADFADLASGGNPGHKYKLIAVADDWLTQQNTVCVQQNNSYLAVPDDLNELGGLFTLAAQADLWVGVNDRIDEGVYKEVLANTIYTALPIVEGTGNQNGQDCIATGDGTTLDTENCADSRVAICECNE